MSLSDSAKILSSIRTVLSCFSSSLTRRDALAQVSVLPYFWEEIKAEKDGIERVKNRSPRENSTAARTLDVVITTKNFGTVGRIRG